ncbi:arylsulfatase [Novosphingobium guangzhouense]|uniref:Arylsulfatase n=1 Tax=Novosphingobium guangzhouense TaxID=1850347 RepID=A0A2K2FU70_9SPHN|nr:arylsulfatase [Novosphingobium guangzhouense]PNU02310.1 arylsulfatase [Novosphingobium guangzhouense]
MSDIDRSRLPLPRPPFAGKIGKTYTESTSAWPELPKPPEGAPNVLLILLDDVGFGQAGTFGGPVPMPTLDKLAAEGLRYTRFHTTAICGPSRAALITGRNHHNCGTGFLSEWATGFPAYNNMIPQTTASLGRILRDNGYATSWFGKNHNTPDWESSVAGPFDRWPTGMGFDYFYGFISGETHQYYPVLFENNSAVEPDRSPEEGYHFQNDITERAMNWIRYSKSVAPDKPFFCYFAPGAAHAPHHAPREWRDKFKGQFDHGWEKVREETYRRQLAAGIIPEGTELTPKPEWVQDWEGLSAEEKKLFARFMENFAGYLAYTDYECGRLVDAVRELPDGDNTIVIYIVGDNGASSEGGPQGTANEVMSLSGYPVSIEKTMEIYDDIGGPNTEPHYPLGWAWCGNAPFQWVKQVASHFGGSRNPMVVSWPREIADKGGIRPQFTHLIDIAPTILAAAGIPAPTHVDGIEQKPMDGVPIQATFQSADAAAVRERQYFEVLSNRAIYDKGWIACAQHTLPWRQDLAPGNWDQDDWELYNIDEDFSEAKNLATAHPEKLEELKRIFDEECEKYGVYPLDDRGAARIAEPKPTPGGTDPDRTEFTYYPGAYRLPETAAPNTKNRSHTIKVEIDNDGKAEGVLVAAGGASAGFSLYVKDGKPTYHYNWFDTERLDCVSSKPLPKGKSTFEVVFAYDGGGLAKGGDVILLLDGEEVAKGRVNQTVPARFGPDTFGVGGDSGSPVANTYKPPFTFTGGRIIRVDIKLAPKDLSVSEEEELQERYLAFAQHIE